MPTPSEHKTVQARILEYAEAIGWTFVSSEEAEQRRGFNPDVPPKDRAKGYSLFFDDLLDARVREFNPRYAEAEGALAVQQSFEGRQTSTEEALAALLKEVETNESRKVEQAAKGFDGLTYSVFRTLLDKAARL